MADVLPGPASDTESVATVVSDVSDVDLFRAISRGDVATCARLLLRDVSCNQPNASGFTPLYEAARFGHYELCALFILRGAGLNVLSSNGLAAIHIASKLGHVNIVRLLLESEASIDKPDGKDGMSPLCFAARHGHYPVCQLLIESGALITFRTPLGEQALHFACAKGHTPICALLMTYDAPVNARNGEGVCFTLYCLQYIVLLSFTELSCRYFICLLRLH